MRRAAGGLLFCAIFLCAFTAQAEDGVDVFGISSEPMQMTIVLCESNSDCASGAECLSAKICIDDMTSQPTGLTCTDDFDCDVGSSCQAVSMCIETGCESDEDCTGDPNGEICNTDTGQCVECLENADCDGNPNGELCDIASGLCVECLVDEDCGGDGFCDRNICGLFECDLRIRPNKIKLKRPKRASDFGTVKMIRVKGVKGQENFNPQGTGVACATDDECDPGFICRSFKDRRYEAAPGTCVPDVRQRPINPDAVLKVEEPKGVEIRKKLLKLRVSVRPDQEPGIYPVRIGNCRGEIEIIGPKK
jgi:hypothetical protein